MSQAEASQSVKTDLAGGQFVHLHNHSHYSLLDGLQKVPGMLDRVKEQGMTAVALTDHGTLSGTIEFYNAARKRGIKPIIGLEAYVSPRGMHEKSGKQDANPYHLILLAKSNQGYANLMKLSTQAHLEGFYYKPRVDRKLLAELHEGIIALSGCASGEVARHILNGAPDDAEETARWYQETFGEGNYYLELQDHEEWEPQVRINKGLIAMSKKTGIPLVVTADSHYSNKGDRDAHEVLLCVQTGKTIGDTDRMEMDMALFVSPPDEIVKRWEHLPGATANSLKIADACGVELSLGNTLIPTFDTPEGQSERDYLHQLCFQGLLWRYGGIPKEDMSHATEARARQELPENVIKRADYELSVIGKMKYEGYFLIVADFINWGKNQGIIFGPGRGSAAGAIIAYALNITDLDPLKYDLLFERFLNPDRISMPDIDIDIQDSRRDEVIAYVTEKYGQDRVAQIITFGTMAARNAVRDTGRALGMSYAEVDAIAKMIPAPLQGRHIPLGISAGIVKSSKEDQRADPDLSAEYKNNPRAKRLIDLAVRLEGTIRSNGVHAAGVVIAPEAIVNYTPLQRAQKGGIVTQYEMHALEDDIGMLKMDFLGLSNLTIVNNTLRIIERVHGVSINIADIPLDDPKAYALLTSGDTTGVFQLESAGMKRYLRELKPNVFSDIIAMVALYRPGPMAELPRYIEGKNDRSKVTYPHPLLKDIFEPTFGVMVYQEQVIAMLQLIAGYTPGAADLVRKAIGKKKRDIMEAEYPRFVQGCKDQGVSKADADNLWAMIQPFADYSFNKSHAACYALIAVQTAYLKSHYPAAFMAALMTSDYGDIDRIAIEVAECRRMGMAVLPPDVNESFAEFGVVANSGAIRFGLSAVKNVGKGAIEAIVAAREAGGPFASIEDFAKRVPASDVNRKVWESLIKAGGMDGFGERSTLLHNLDTVISYASKAQKNALSGQIDIFGSLGVEDNMPGLRLDLPSEVANSRDQLQWERELLGLYLSSHPLDDFEAYLADNAIPLKLLTPSMEGRTVKAGGMITTVRKILTKKNDTMAFVTIEDRTGSLELIVFPKAYEKTPNLWEPDKIVQVAGKISAKDRDGKLGTETKIMVDSASEINYELAKGHKSTGKPMAASLPPTFKRMPTPEANEDLPEQAEVEASLIISLREMTDTAVLTSLKEIISGAPGDAKAYLILPNMPQKRILLAEKVTISPQLLSRLDAAIGEGAARAINV